MVSPAPHGRIGRNTLSTGPKRRGVRAALRAIDQVALLFRPLIKDRQWRTGQDENWLLYFFCSERFYRLTFRPETAISDMSSYSKNCIWERPSGRFLRFWATCIDGGFCLEASLLMPSFLVLLFSQLILRCRWIAQVAPAARPRNPSLDTQRSRPLARNNLP